MNSYRYEPRLRKRGMLAGIIVIGIVGSLMSCVLSIASNQRSDWADRLGQRELRTGSMGALSEQAAGG